MSLVTRRTEVVEARHAGSEHDDRSLVEAAGTNLEAVAVLYRRHVQAVYAHAYRLCGNKEVAEEATSATFERVLGALPGYVWQPSGIRPWLLRIAGNEVAALYRRRSRDDSPRARQAMQELSIGEGAGSNDVLETEQRNEHVLAEVRAAMPLLSARYRNVIELRYLRGLSPSEAAEALGCSKAVLAVTLHRALGALRQEIQHVKRDQR